MQYIKNSNKPRNKKPIEQMFHTAAGALCLAWIPNTKMIIWMNDVNRQQNIHHLTGTGSIQYITKIMYILYQTKASKQAFPMSP